MMVQVIRNEYVTNVPVRVLGDTGPERVQITGALRVVRFADRVVVGSAPGRNAGPLRRRRGASRAVEGGAAQSVDRRCRGRHHGARGGRAPGTAPARVPRGSAASRPSEPRPTAGPSTRSPARSRLLRFTTNN